MIKSLSKLMLGCAVTLTACSQGVDDAASYLGLGDASVPGQGATVTMALSRAAASEFIQAGIQKFTVYVYKVERRGSALFMEKEFDVSNPRVDFEFPLGETYQTFAVANASGVTDKEACETAMIHLDPNGGSDVWLTSPVRFSTDKSVSEVSLEMRRVVSRLTFAAAENDTPDGQALLASQTDFDRIDVTFKNVADAYLVSKMQAQLSEVTVSVDAASQYGATIYTFETRNTGVNGALSLSYMKGGVQVNTSSSDLDVNSPYTSGAAYTLKVPVTDINYMADEWARSAMSPLTVTISDL